jgi:DNA-3-methyladenine glycosylase I
MRLVLVSDLYKEYHDKEWGTPVYDDATFIWIPYFRNIQADSWITVLNKENFRKAFIISTTKNNIYEDKIEHFCA